MAELAGTPGGAARRRVLVAFHEQVLGGATLSLLRLVPLLEREGYDFTFWVPSPSPLATELRRHGHRVAGVPRPIAFSRQALALAPGGRSRLLATPGYLGAFARHLRSVRPDLVHANALFTLPEAIVARALRLPVVFHVHEMVPAGAKGGLARRAAFAIGAEVVAVSEASAAELTSGRRRPRIVHEAAPIPADAPDRSGRSGPTVIGTVGVISRRKGSDVFVEAARLAREQEPGLSFRMVGAATDELDTEWAAGILERAAQVGIEHTERDEDVPGTLAGWDVFALPSRWDPYPISMLEAMGAGLAVIGTAVDGIPEQLGGNCGLIIEPESPQALASAILRLHREPALRAALGAAARERAVARFGLDRQAASLSIAYEAALARRSTASR